MKKIVKGVVKYIADEKKYDNYGLRLVDQEVWYNSPNRAKGILEPGYTVKLVVEENERGGFNVVKKPELIKKGAPPAKGGRRGGFGGGFKKDPEVEKRIVMQHSQEMGIALATLVIAQGGIKLPKTKPDAIKTAVVALVDEFAAKSFKDAYNADRVLKAEEEVEDDLDDSEAEEPEEESEEEETEESGDDAEESEEIEDDVPWDKE